MIKLIIATLVRSGKAFKRKTSMIRKSAKN